MKRVKGRRATGICFFAFFCNTALFFLKLYVGLSSNSICIYSDGVNNMFDGLAALVAGVCIFTLASDKLIGSCGIMKKTEELLTTVLYIGLLFSGVYFAYNSAERLMYPTPVWYSVKYLYILLFTVAAKLLMAAFYWLMNKKDGLKMVKIMSADCISDAFITAVTVISLLISGNGTVAADAFSGIIISIVIVVAGGKGLAKGIRNILGYIPSDKREEIEEILKSGKVDTEKADFNFFYNETPMCYISFSDSSEQKKAELLYDEICEHTGVTLKSVINGKE